MGRLQSDGASVMTADQKMQITLKMLHLCDRDQFRKILASLGGDLNSVIWEAPPNIKVATKSIENKQERCAMILS